MKSVKRILLAILAIIVLLVLGMFSYLRFGLPNVGAAPNMTIPATPELLARGDYLVNHVVMCLDCHSERDWSKFAGPIKPGTEGKGGEVFDQSDGIPGKLVANNITPYHLQSWSDGELFRVIVSGVNKSGEPLFPLMAYPKFNRLDPDDVHAIIAYMRSIKPITSEPPTSHLDFPLNWIVRTIPMKYQPSTRPSISDTVSYGKYMITAALCADCHTPMDDKGQPIAGKSYAGGNPFPIPTGGKVHSANITPDKETGIGKWTEEEFVLDFKQYTNPDAMPKYELGKFNTVMPWASYAGMKEEDLRAIYKYLQTIPPVRNKVETFYRNNIPVKEKKRTENRTFL